MKYIKIKDSIELNFSDFYIYMNNPDIKLLPKNWSLEFFFNCNLENNNKLKIFSYRLFELDNSKKSTDVLQFYINNKKDIIIKILNENNIDIQDVNLNHNWTHIAINHDKRNDNLIIYVNGYKKYIKNISMLEFEKYSKFDRFVFTVYKGENTINYTGIQLYRNIKHTENSFTPDYPIS